MSEENMPGENSGQMQNEGEGMGGSGSSSKMKTIVAVVIVLAVAGALYAMTKTDTSAPEAEVGEDVTATENTAVANQPEIAAPVEGEQPFPRDINQADGSVTVTFNDTGYVPAEVTVKKGQTVNFKNESAIATWPASAMHPTHTVYPGSDIQKCGTDAAVGIFDACGGLNTGESWSFQFNETGIWKYHDHLNAGKFGTIIVTE